MKKRILNRTLKTIILIIVILLTVSFSVVFISSCPSLDIIAQEEINVYEDIDDALSASPQERIGKLSEGQRAVVLKCIDVKHYQIYKIRLPDGRKGFVNDGKYSLVKRK